jgi:hypothetical protein
MDRPATKHVADMCATSRHMQMCGTSRHIQGGWAPADGHRFMFILLCFCASLSGTTPWLCRRWAVAACACLRAYVHTTLSVCWLADCPG